MSTRLVPILGRAALVSAITGLVLCAAMFAWGVGHFTGALLASTVEMQTDRMLEAGVPQPVIEAVRVGEPIESPEFLQLGPDTRELVRSIAGQVEAVRESTAHAAASGRRSAAMVAMVCTAMALVGVFIITRARRA